MKTIFSNSNLLRSVRGRESLLYAKAVRTRTSRILTSFVWRCGNTRMWAGDAAGPPGHFSERPAPLLLNSFYCLYLFAQTEETSKNIHWNEPRMRSGTGAKKKLVARRQNYHFVPRRSFFLYFFFWGNLRSFVLVFLYSIFCGACILGHWLLRLNSYFCSSKQNRTRWQGSHFVEVYFSINFFLNFACWPNRTAQVYSLN